MDKRLFYKVLCEEVDVFGKEIYEDVNRGTMDEVCNFIQEHKNDHMLATWIVIPMAAITEK